MMSPAGDQITGDTTFIAYNIMIMDNFIIIF